LFHEDLPFIMGMASPEEETGVSGKFLSCLNRHWGKKVCERFGVIAYGNRFNPRGFAYPTDDGPL
jgi:hypothetical protein